MFQELGAYLIDADIVARQVVEPGQPAWEEIVEHFGPHILLDNKQIDRKKLGSIIFHQPEERRILNQIIHPRVIEDIDRQIQDICNTQPDRVILIDVPLLIEASMQNTYAKIIVVYVSENVQLTRLMDRDNISEQEAWKKIRAQMLLSEKVKYATHVIRNDETLDKTKKQVIKVYQEISIATQVAGSKVAG
jgi:dephospho-CoA kinase